MTQLAAHSFDKAMFRLELQGVPRAHVQLTRDKLLQPDVGLIRQLENRVASLPRLAADVTQRKAEAQTRIEQATRTLEGGFKHEAALRDAREKAADINAALEKLQRDQEPEPAPEQMDPDVARMRRLHAASYPGRPGVGPAPQAPKGPATRPWLPGRDTHRNDLGR
ncbi:hypothetical protein [Paenarthrobacter ureafaciens]|uniref:hypothetical protein n=1 Tax=Paenarthrobacter ureafaciens TaxID=37931 RepID=UPI0034639A44